MSTFAFRSVILAAALGCAAGLPQTAAANPNGPQAASAATGNPRDVRPKDRVTGAIASDRRVALTGSRHPLAQAANLIGELTPGERLQGMVFVLRPAADQKAALEELVRAQQDPASPDYHQWLTPETFGEHYGISQNDLNKIANWLESQGMQVDEIPPSHRSIVFSGTARQVEEAFHTPMRRYSVNGETHFANAADPEIPEALAEVVEGIVSLHDFRTSTAHLDMPAYTIANGSTFLMPQDWNTIYDVTPLYGQGLDGSGQSIAVVGRTDVDLTDVRTFRTNAALPGNDPQKIFVNGVNPGMPNCVDEAEAALDVEWAGAIARNATVKYVAAASGATDGVILAAQYAVTHNVAPIVSVSYLHCEGTLSDGGLSLWGALWQQAASQGQSVFVASGDSGAAGCDLASAKTATQGKAVNAICSSPYSTCVGGTEFSADNYNPSLYWSATNGAGQSSVLSYIPEAAWNETGWSGTITTASGGGVSTVYARPAWQTGPGVPAGTMRTVPDISASSAIHDAYVIQIQGKPFYVAGTSAATPSLASVMALVLQSAASPLGNVNAALYTLASQQSTGGPAVFHDITSGNNSVPGVTGYNAGAGYDMVTGLGSVDAFLLVNSWANSRASNFTLAANSPALTVTPGKSTSATVTMSAAGGFNSPVTLAATGAPAGVTVNLSSPSLTSAAGVTMTVNAASSAAVGAWPVVITGTGGGYKRAVELVVTVAAPTFTLASNYAAATLAPGGATPLTLTTAGSNGFNSAVALSISGLPSGVTPGFSPTSIAAPGSGTSTLTIAASAAATPGTYSATVTATGGGVTRTQAVSVTVTAPVFTLAAGAASTSIAPGGSMPIVLTTTGAPGFNSALALSISGLPAGVTGIFSPTSIAAPGSGSITLTLAASAAAAPGTYTATVSATGGGTIKTQPLSVTVTAPSFVQTPGASSVIEAPGGSMPIAWTIAGATGFNSAVALSISGLPAGVTGIFSPTSIAAPGSGKSTLTLAASAAATPGTYTATVTATGGGATKTQPLSLTVTAPVFTLVAGAASTSIAPGGSMPIVLTTTGAPGFNSAVAISISGLPSGVTGTFSPTIIAAPGSGSITLTLAASAAATPGTYSATVTATGGGATKTQPLSLTVTAPSFVQTPGASSVIEAPGGSMPIAWTITGATGFNSAVALSISGLPAGVTGTFSPTIIAAPGSGKSTLTLAASAAAAPGTYTATVSATGGGVTKTQPLSLTVTAPVFTLVASATSTSMAPGGSMPLTFTTTGAPGFNAAVALSINGLPSGVTGLFSPTSIAAPGSGKSTLTLTGGATAAPGTYTATVSATGGGVTRTQALALTVLLPSYSLTPSATSLTVAAGSSKSIAVTGGVLNGFSAAVALSISAPPKGVTASFAPATLPAPGSGTSTLTVSVASGTASGACTLTVTATGGGLTKTQAISLIY